MASDAGDGESRFAAIFEAALDAMLIADDDRRYRDANPAACRLLGRSRDELLGLRIEDVSPLGSDVEGAWQSFLAQDEVSGEYTLVRPDGSVVDVEFRAKAHALPGQHLSILRDVTERKVAETRADEVRRLQQHLQRSDRLRAVGQLTGGIAHDFNNLLLAVSAFAELGQRRLEAGEDIRDALAQIMGLVERGSNLVSDLLAFARREDASLEPAFLAPVVAALRPVIAQLLPEDIDVRISVPEDLPAVRVPNSELERLLLNLILNARDAMPHGGALTIHGSEVQPTAADGRWVQLTITDTGVGMTVDVLDRAFEPFFTTKPAGSGSGLGLAGVHGIVQAAGGHVVLDSEPGAGTTVSVHLPAAGASATPAPGGAPSDASAPPEARTATLLLVEDQEAIRNVLTAAFERAGHRVIAVADGGAAIDAAEAAEAAGRSIDVIVADVVMPILSGPEVVARLRQRRHHLPAVLMSGYAADHLDAVHELDASTTRFLTKPFTLEELHGLIAELLI